MQETLHRILYRNPYRANGVVAIEFAFLLVLLLMIVGGIIEFGRTFWYYDALTKATRDGARFMSTLDNGKFESETEGIPAARTLVFNIARSANVPLVSADENVVVTCLPSDCAVGTAPEYVVVSIQKFQMTIGGLFPLFVPSGGTTTYTPKIEPHTTMRYMLQEE